MFLTEITLNDLRLLEQFRSERLRSLFAESLAECPIYVDGDTAIVHCPHTSNIESLLVDSSELGEYAGLILGVRSIAIYLLQAEIYRAECGIGTETYELC